MSTIEATLGISAVSIVLLFASMALIWLLMSLMSRISVEKKSEPAAVVEKISEVPAAAAVPQEDKTMKAKAAAAAVAAALALHKSRARLAPPASSSAATSWQSVHRASAISRRNQIFSRKRG